MIEVLCFLKWKINLEAVWNMGWQSWGEGLESKEEGKKHIARYIENDEYLKQGENIELEKNENLGLSCDPVVRTQHFHCRRHSFNP